MKRTLILASVVLVALVATGFAVANGIEGVRSAKAVAGTFATGTPSQFRTRSCTTTDGKTLVATEGVYTGPATGDADLAGTATLRARSLINSTDGVGVVSGTLRIHVASGGDTVAHFDTVYSAGQIAGLASGHAQDPHAKLLANLSSAFNFTSTGAFTTAANPSLTNNLQGFGSSTAGLFLVDGYGDLNSVNAFTGAPTLIGPTGVAGLGRFAAVVPTTPQGKIRSRKALTMPNNS